MAPLEVAYGGYEQPISRTYQYRKVMKPMLERKRRARINRCLDELKNLMVSSLQSEGENTNKLEKADILELTVRHLQKLEHQNRLAGNPVVEVDRFRSGFTHCVTEVSQCLAALPGVDINLGTKLMTHLGHRLNQLTKPQMLSMPVSSSPAHNSTIQPQTLSPPVSPVSMHSPSSYYETSPSPLTPLSIENDFCSTSSCSCCTAPRPEDRLLKIATSVESDKNVWRPW